MAKNEDRKVICSFCGRSQDNVHRMIAGPGVYICDDCIKVCINMLGGEELDDDANIDYTITEKAGDLPTPEEIKNELDQYVIGQEEAKKALSVAVYNHYKRINNPQKDPNDVEIQKSNILLLGPTGSGKTLLAQSLARYLRVPFAIADATTLTEAGYVGEDVENILLKLIQNADFDIQRAEKGIIYIDEIDKIARKSENTSITRDVSGEGVQQSLLKIVEGTVASVPPQGGRKHPMQEMLRIDTKNILFICGGAFDGLDKIINHRIGKKQIGFGADIKTKKEIDKYAIYEQLLPQDLLKFGLIPEFVGRLPVIATLRALDKEALKKILIEPKNSITKQYIKLLKLDNVELVFEDEAINEVVNKAIERDTGARGLRAILEDVMRDIMFEIPSNKTISKCVITKATVNGKEKPRLEYKNSKTSTKNENKEDNNNNNSNSNNDNNKGKTTIKKATVIEKKKD